MYIYICIYIYASMHLCIYIIHAPMSIYIYIYVYLYLYTHLSINASMHLYIYIIYTSMHLCIYTPISYISYIDVSQNDISYHFGSRMFRSGSHVRPRPARAPVRVPETPRLAPSAGPLLRRVHHLLRPLALEPRGQGRGCPRLSMVNI